MKLGKRLATWLAFFCVTGGALQAQSNPIDDIIRLAMDAFNDFRYPAADSIARSVLDIQSASLAQRTRAQMVMAAAAFPEEAGSQRRVAALSIFKQILRSNYEASIPRELAWAGLDSLLEEARRSTFGMQVSGTAVQAVVGPDGLATLHVKSNKPGLFRLLIVSKANNSVAIVDSLKGTAEGDIVFKTMRDRKPVFSSGDYTVTITAFEPAGRGDTVTAQYGLKVDAPPLTFAAIPAKMDSSKLLSERSGKYGMKAILPAVIVGAVTFFISSSLHGDGGLSSGSADGKGIGVAGGMVAATLFAGFADHGRPIPENIAANIAAGEAFQKSIVDAQAENQRRIAEFRTVLTFDLTAR